MAKEKEVVLQEIKQTNDDPNDIVFDYFQSKAFAEQPLGMSILGPAANVRNFTADNLRSYMNTHYAAEDMIFTAVGNLEHQKFVDMVEKRIQNLHPKTSFSKPQQIYTGGEFIKVRDTEQAQVLLGFPGVDYHSPYYYPLTILSTILGGSMSSRLFQEIREKRGVVYSVYSFTNSHINNGLFGIYAGLNQEEIKNYIPVVADEVKKICNEPVNDQEFNRVKVQLKASLLMALESSASTAEVVSRQHLVHNRVLPVSEIVERIDNVSKQDIMTIAQRVFSGKPTYTLMGNLGQYPNYEQIEKYFHL